jgi:hypothetical protein
MTEVISWRTAAILSGRDERLGEVAERETAARSFRLLRYKLENQSSELHDSNKILNRSVRGKTLGLCRWKFTRVG